MEGGVESGECRRRKKGLWGIEPINHPQFDLGRGWFGDYYGQLDVYCPADGGFTVADHFCGRAFDDRLEDYWATPI